MGDGYIFAVVAIVLHGGYRYSLRGVPILVIEGQRTRGYRHRRIVALRGYHHIRTRLAIQFHCIMCFGSLFEIIDGGFADGNAAIVVGNIDSDRLCRTHAGIAFNFMFDKHILAIDIGIVHRRHDNGLWIDPVLLRESH